MALPTAATPGYTYFPAKYGPDVACVCLAAWFPWFRRLCVANGLGDPVIWQATGDNPLSVGSHAKGGTFDIGGIGRPRVALGREMGAWAMWERNWTGNVHTHGVLAGCTHLSDLSASQLREVRANGDGLAGPGLDPFPDPKVYRTWKQGIEWAKAEIARITGQQIIDNLETVMALSDADKTWLLAQFQKMATWSYKNPDTTRDAYDYLRNPGLDVWDDNYVTRDGVKVSMKQELANIGTQGKATAGAVADLRDAVANLVALIQESHPKAEPVPEPAPLPVPAFGFDVSRHQTTEEVKAVLQGQPDFCIINASTGLFSKSSALAANETVARAWADVTGFYHWGQTVNSSATTPDKSDPIGEAKHYLATIAPYLRVGDLLCLDNEENLGTFAQRVAYDIAWLEHNAAAKDARPLNYKNWSWIKGIREAATVEQWERWCKFDIWLADPSGVPGKHEQISPKPGTTVAPRILVHQYAVINDMDHNWTHDLAALKACGVKRV